jgi:hypothetical protein
MSNHTPGPWHLGHSGYANTPFIVYPDGQPRPDWRKARPVPYILALVEQDEGPDHKTQEANARLIAAAPELLAALEQIKRLSLEADRSRLDVASMLGDIARAAIAKV